MRPYQHYLGVAALIVLAYFLIVAPVVQAIEQKPFKNAVVSVQPTPDPKVKAAEIVAQALKDQAVAAAVSNQSLQLSAAQQTVADTIQRATGIAGQLAAAAAVGLTRPAPKVQVITVATKAQAQFAKPSPAPDDDAIKRDMKEVLASTPLNVNTATNVKVSWEDRPYSPVFAAYAADGASGIGYTLHAAPVLDLDALALQKHGQFEIGAGLDHTFKGTSFAGGVYAALDLKTKSPVYGAFVGIKM